MRTNQEVHPRIIELIKAEMTPERHGRSDADQAYTAGWIAGTAMECYVDSLSRVAIPDASEHIRAFAECQCAEIGFWTALTEFHRARQKMSRKSRRTFAS